MKQFAGRFILYIVLALAGLSITQPTFAAFQCQVVYGGGEICQNQKDVKYTYTASPTPTNTITPTPTTIPVPPTSALPSTGTSFWSLLLIGASGIGGALLLLL